MSSFIEMNIALRMAAGIVMSGLAAGFIMLATSMPANARPDVRKMTCSQAQSLVKSEGAIVLTFTNNTYDRVVKNVLFCDAGYQWLEDMVAKTRDNNQCVVGSICVTPPDHDDCGFSGPCD